MNRRKNKINSDVFTAPVDGYYTFESGEPAKYEKGEKVKNKEVVAHLKEYLQKLEAMTISISDRGLRDHLIKLDSFREAIKYFEEKN